jgi:hypothetical protein
MTLIEAIVEWSNRAIEEMGAPLTLIVAGTDLWVSISRSDAERHTKVLLDAIGEPDDHLPLLLIFPADIEADGHYRPIEISVLNKNVQVRSRKGYFAPQQ